MIKQSRESYHKITIRGIRSSLTELSSCADKTKMIYCPSHKDIYENEMVDSLARVTAKKATHLPPKIHLNISYLKNANTQKTNHK